jgi:uracil-DNA glycosylase
LRIIFGHGLGSDDAGEWITPVHGHAFHIFDGFALVNRLLCSAGPEGGSQGRSTTTMRDNCLEHFEATLAILDPTIVVLQGALVAKSSAEALPVATELSSHLYESRGTSGRRVMVCHFSHPAARGLLRWGDRLDSPYLNDIVVPTLQRAVKAP